MTRARELPALVAMAAEQAQAAARQAAQAMAAAQVAALVAPTAQVAVAAWVVRADVARQKVVVVAALLFPAGAWECSTVA